MHIQVTFGKRDLDAVDASRSSSFYSSADVSAPTPQNMQANGAAAVDMGSVSEADMKLAIGRNWRRYQRLWPSVREQCMRGKWSPKISLSLPGFFFGAAWLLYRKQYSASFVAIVTSMAIGFVVPGHVQGLNLLVSVLISLFGKWWVVRNAASMAARIRSLGYSEAETTHRIGRLGGVSWIGPMVVVLVLSATAGPAFVKGFVKGFEEGRERSIAAQAKPQ